MKKMMLVFAFLFVSMSATSAFALDLCAINGFGQLYKFDNVKLLKNKTTPLTGRFHFSGSNDNKPLFGSATLDNDNLTVRIFILAEGSAVQFTESMTGDKKFNAVGSFDNAPLGSTTGANTWANIPCTRAFPGRGCCGSYSGSCTRSSGVGAEE